MEPFPRHYLLVVYSPRCERGVLLETLSLFGEREQVNGKELLADLLFSVASCFTSFESETDSSSLGAVQVVGPLE